MVTIPDARHVAGGGRVVIARDRALLSVAYSDWTKPPYEVAWSEPILAIGANDGLVAVADRVSVSLVDGRLWSMPTRANVPAPGAIRELEVLHDGTALAFDGSGTGWTIDFRRGISDPLAAKASLVAAFGHVFFVQGREASDYDPRKKTVTGVGRIGSGARSIATWDEQVAFGFESGEVVLGKLAGAKLETERLTAKPAER